MESHLVVVGQMASGKTTMGRILARRLDRRLSDSDAWIRSRYRIDAAGLLGRDGLDALHDAEARHLHRALGEREPLVIAAAAAVIDRPRLVERLRAQRVVWLRARPETLAARAAADPRRPMLGDPLAYLRRLAARRRPLLEGLADVIVDVDRITPDHVAAIVADRLALRTGR